MSVYVSDKRQPVPLPALHDFHLMCADTADELRRMLHTLGLPQSHIQYPHTVNERVALDPKDYRRARAHGAIHVTWKQYCRFQRRVGART